MPAASSLVESPIGRIAHATSIPLFTTTATTISASTSASTSATVQMARAARAGVAAVALAVAVVMVGASAQRADAREDAGSGRHSSRAVDVVFVLDNSGSMRQNDPAYLTRAAVSNFADALARDADADGRIGIVLFDGEARLVQSLTPVDAGATDGLLRRALASLDFSGQRTNSPAGIERALYELREKGRPEGRRAIVFLTDGKIDTGNAQKDREATGWLKEDLAAESHSLGIRIFSIAFTDAADYQLMQAVARKTRGRYYRAYHASELRSVVDDVLQRVDEDDIYALAVADADPIARPQTDNAGSLTSPRNSRQTPPRTSPDALPNVASAPTPEAARAQRFGIGLLGWMPVAVLLIAGAILWRRRSVAPPIDALIAQAELDMDAPAAQLLDFGGHVGDAGTALPLKRGRNRVGRDPHNDIVLDDDAISSEHAVIEVHDGRYWVEDRRSTNGTRIGEERLEPNQRMQLKGGDHVRFAEVDLMFVLTGYVPGGATVFLTSTTEPPQGWRDLEPVVPPPLPALSKEPADVKDLDAGLAVEWPPAPPTARTSETPQAPQAHRTSETPQTPESPSNSLLHDPGADSESSGAAISATSDASSASSTSSASTVERSRYRECLDHHFARVEEISPAFSAFIERAFDSDLRDALAVSASDLVGHAFDSHSLQCKDYTLSGIRYVICAVPGEMETARDCFVETFGGFTRLLTEQLISESFRQDRCDTLAVLTFGRGAVPWVSLSIVPDEGEDPRIDLLSYEFLTDGERNEIEPQEPTDISQSGLG